MQQAEHWILSSATLPHSATLTVLLQPVAEEPAHACTAQHHPDRPIATALLANTTWNDLLVCVVTQ